MELGPFSRQRASVPGRWIMNLNGCQVECNYQVRALHDVFQCGKQDREFGLWKENFAELI